MISPGMPGYSQEFVATKSGAEFHVNTTYTSGYQIGPDAAMDDEGNFVIVWYSSGQDGSEYGVYARRYNSSGILQGSEFRVNTTVSSIQALPQVAMDDAGNFVIVWASDNQDGDAFGVYGQRYNALGEPQGSEFRVNTTTTGEQNAPAVAMDGLGNFVVIWASNGQSNGDQIDVYGQRYNSSGVLQGSEFRVNTTIEGNQGINTTASTPPIRIAMDNSGNFVVVWTADGQDGDGYGLYAQRYNAAGIPLNSEFRVNTTTAGAQHNPCISVDGLGNFWVVWRSGNDQDGDGDGIYGQRYDANGIPQGTEFQVNNTIEGMQIRPWIDVNSQGQTIITWAGPGVDGEEVYGRLYDASGISQGEEFRINTYTTNTQSRPAVAINNNGNLIIVWESSGQDGSSIGVYAQICVLNYSPVMDDQSFSIQEYSPNGTTVDTVLANDSNQGQSLTYAITNGNTGNVFVINSSTGEITVTGTLVYDIQPTYTLTVEVTDNGASPQSVSATVTINLSKLPDVFIQGPETVGQNTFQAYSIVPANNIYSYQWSYTDTSASLPDTSSRNIFIGFNKEGSGTLQCIIRKISPAFVVDTLSLEITANEGTGYTLPNTLCPEIVPVEPCAGSYIDGFSLADIQSKNSGCTPSGYRDNTQSATNSRLYLGDNYSATLNLGYNGSGSPVYYTGLWIDYNNNGSFDDNGEFLSSNYGNDTIIVLSYLPVSNNLDFEGPRRLRVQVRTSGAFEGEEGCIAFGETGETEDYLVVLTSHDRLEGAHLVTPNADGKNDFFVIHGIDSEVSSNLVIYDRLGKTLFTQKEYINDWSGTDDSGELLPPGIYYYVFENGDDTLKGFFQLNY